MKVAFIGHRKIADNSLGERLTETILNLIVKQNADTFIFGSKSQFDSLSYSVVSELKKAYPHICRIYVRADYEEVEGRYEKYLLSLYEKTCFPREVKGAGLASYIRRNFAMIDMCDLLVTYYDKNYSPEVRRRTNSGTRLAVGYAEKTGKPVLNLF